ncbi:organic solvent tolerance protein [Haloferula helveola]|uniref:Organic solvent tolerance protein n=1 Tax=Haloferula helveola TaxID=490095 RepID=A0ABN6H6C3_9BACT|nr:organic solvent tolerance protein [Haloferula helveola]
MRLATFLLSSLLPVAAQDLLPDENEPAPIAPVAPVPLPTDADLLDAEELAPAKPESVALEFSGGADYKKDTETLTSRGAVSAVADTGMSLRANKGAYDGKNKLLKVDGNVKLKTETGVEIFADHGVLDDAKRTVTLTGNVSIYQGATLQRGERVVYLMDQKKIDASNLRTGVDPLLLEAGGFTVEERDGEQVFVGRDAGITTHDVEDPGFWVRADETTVYPDDRITFRNMKLYAGETPIFWLPYLSQPLDGDLGYHFTPGARSNWGVYLLNSYGIMLGESDSVSGEDAWLLSRWNFDLRSKRGIGAGVDLIDRRQDGNPNLTGFSLYYANDLDPTLSRTGLPRTDVNEDRWHARLQYRVPLPFEDGETWRVDTNLNALSDKYYLEDFDPRLFRTDPAPDNTIGLFRHSDTSLFGVLGRVRPNDFYRSDSRAEISFDQARRPIFGSPILHEGQTTLGIVQEEIGSDAQSTARALLALPAASPLIPTLYDRLPTYERQLVRLIRALPPGSPAIPSLTTQLLAPSYNRFHTYQEFSLPMKLGGWLNFTPEVGAGFSRYGAVSGPATSISRTHLYAGAEASVKFSRDFGDYRDRDWGLDGLLHVFQPYVRFSYVNTDDLDALFPVIDRENFTTRPRTLAPNRFTAIDSLRDWSIIRFGMRNRLITRRDGQSYEWLYLDTYMDGFFEDPELNRSFSNLYNDLNWNPLPWLGLRLETQFPIFDDGSGFSEVSARLRFMPNENVEFSIASRNLNNHPILVDSNRIDLRGYVRLNDKWGLGATQIWELDDGTLEVQQYTVHRDFNHWVASLGFTARDNRVDEEYGVVLAFTLKDFPSASLPLSLDAQ